MARRKTKKGLSVEIRRWQEEDIPGIYACEKAAYSEFPEPYLCDERHLRLQFQAFADGQFLAEAGGRIVGYAASLIVQLDDDSPWYSYPEITGMGTFSTHNPAGDTLYGADIAVHPDFRGQGIAGLLYEQRKRLLRRLNLRRMVAGGRIPGYREVSGRMTPEEYIQQVIRGELKDIALNAHLKAGYRVLGVHMDYMSDAASLNYATFLEMPNPEYRPERRKIAAVPIRRPVRRIRLCAAQFEMRRIRAWEEFEKQIEFFITTADEYHCHAVLFPEWVTAPLFSLQDPGLPPREAVKHLADHTGRYLEMFTRLARQYRMHILGGSHPVQGESGLKNTAHLFTPAGGVYTQEKLHVTPGEREYRGIRPGEHIRIFDTGLARIAVQIGYDIEFPEVSRLLALSGVEVLFVPFNTDERKAYTRIRYSARARAVENWVYVAISGSVGNLPNVRGFMMNYGQTAVFTPSDVAFPIHAVIAEADPNAETMVITDLDLGSLSVQREFGTVRPFRDRRPDLYELKPKIPIQIIRTY